MPELPHFQSDADYLEWELRCLQEQLLHYVNVKKNPSQTSSYLACVEHLSALRGQARAERATCDLAFERMSRRFSLTPDEELLLIICVAPRLSAPVGALLHHAQGDRLTRYLEVGFVSELVSGASGLLTRTDWCQPTATLPREGLVVIESPADGGITIPRLRHGVYAPHFVTAALSGEAVVDEQLARVAQLSRPDRALFEIVLSNQAKGCIESFVRGIYEGSPGGKSRSPESQRWRLMVQGPRRSGKTMVVEALAALLGTSMLTLDMGRLSRSQALKLLRLAEHNARFHGALWHIVQPELSLSNPELLGALKQLTLQFDGVVVFECHDGGAFSTVMGHDIDFEFPLSAPTVQERLELWESAMPLDAMTPKDDVSLAELATGYELTGGQIVSAVLWARQLATTRGDQLSQGDLEAGAESQLRSQLDHYTEPATTKLGLDHLVLPESTMTEVRELLDACKERRRVLAEWGLGERLVTGKGLVALLSGEAGTGKTLTAEILAAELGQTLHIVSIPKVVSKWVGETEKNIRTIFAQARNSNSVLLFDEADSLFAKRVKVERAQDHFQNMEVNNLLQEIERFEGVVLLTTNHEVNIDRAFQRRILFKIEFPVPEAPERERIWKSLIPSQMPREPDIDFELLAEAFELTGGQIKNAITRAAYRCSAQSHGLNEHELERAAQQQARAAGRLSRPLSEHREARNRKAAHRAA